MTTITDLSRFGSRELEIASNLLKALADNKIDDDLKFSNKSSILFNTISGQIFLSDEDYNVGILNDNGVIERWYICANCSNEGFKNDVKSAKTDKCNECKKII